ncbi:MAG: hypothetical protein A4E49_01560 [Methanosaeta sp. PtaU1.Bin112]|nr:MAG: hypothetical protein A4E49_01560 [Methanosaeta sp. PtaU1.Bin112]
MEETKKCLCSSSDVRVVACSGSRGPYPRND